MSRMSTPARHRPRTGPVGRFVRRLARRVAPRAGAAIAAPVVCALAQMLRVARAGRYASDFMVSLPLAGEDGTMRSRLKDNPATGWARLKTGTLRNVAALAGYVRNAEGRPWAVAMMLNHDRARAARPALDALVDAIARSPRPGDWREPANASVRAREPLAQAEP